MSVMAEAPGLRERKKQQTRAVIARAAITLFLERGFDHVSIAEVAEAAGVAKMTVTNYFPTKEDLVISAQVSLIPDLAGAVRGRAPGESPVAALHRFYRAELDRRAEWTQLHDGVTPFARMTLASPTLLGAFARAWGEVEVQLARAFAEIEGDAGGDRDGDGVTAGSAAGRAMMLLQSGAPADQELAGLAASISIPRIRAEVAAGQVGATIRALSNANLVRQAAGLTTDQTADQSYAEAAAAFALLESGLAAYGS
jgi:AcrR family transcriptional regulator